MSTGPANRSLGTRSTDRRVKCGGRQYPSAPILPSAFRRGDLDLARFLQTAAGSASELEYRLARDLGLLQGLDYDGQAEEVRQMLAAPLKTLRADG